MGPYLIELAIFVHQINGHPNFEEIAAMILMANAMVGNSSLGFDIRVKPLAIEYIDGPRNYIPLERGDLVYTLKRFNNYLTNYKITNKMEKAWDAAAFISPALSIPGGPAGMAYSSSICCDEKNGFILNYFGLGTATTFVHELGHLLGASHDVGHGAVVEYNAGQIACHSKQRGIMGYKSKNRERYTWSKCSLINIRNNLRKKGECLLVNNSKRFWKYYESLKFISYSPDKICKSQYGEGYRCDFKKSTCLDLYCKHGSWTDDGFNIVLDNTPCLGKWLMPYPTNSVCKMGVCTKLKEEPMPTLNYKSSKNPTNDAITDHKIIQFKLKSYVIIYIYLHFRHL